MKLKKGILLFLFSVVLVFTLVPLGGYGGHHYKFSAAALLYFLCTWYFLNKAVTKKEKVWIVVLLLLPPLVLYMPLHIADFESTQLGMPSTAAHFIGVMLAILVHISNRIIKVSLIFLLLLLSTWTTLKGYELWLNKLKFGTYTGSVSEQLPRFILLDSAGNTITNKAFENKLVVMDFWNTGCGICFKKLPLLQQKGQAYKDLGVEFYAVNIPLSRDTLGQGKSTMEKLDYSFPNLYASSQEVAELFGVMVYPTVLLIKNGNQVVYRGDIEGVEKEIAAHL